MAVLATLSAELLATNTTAGLIAKAVVPTLPGGGGVAAVLRFAT